MQVILMYAAAKFSCHPHSPGNDENVSNNGHGLKTGSFRDKRKQTQNQDQNIWKNTSAVE